MSNAFQTGPTMLARFIDRGRRSKMREILTEMRLVAPALTQALELGTVEVVGQDRLVVGVGTLLDDLTGTLARRHAGNIGETDFGDNHVDC
jgi:hypothetical protein